jgi:hypothetical protein
MFNRLLVHRIRNTIFQLHLAVKCGHTHISRSFRHRTVFRPLSGVILAVLHVVVAVGVAEHVVDQHLRMVVIRDHLPRPTRVVARVGHRGR